MVVNDDKITEMQDFVSLKLKEYNEIQTKYGDLHRNLISIKKRIQSIQNDKGGTDKVDVIPNDKKLKDSDNNKIRQIIYNNCIAEYNILKASA